MVIEMKHKLNAIEQAYLDKPIWSSRDIAMYVGSADRNFGAVRSRKDPSFPRPISDYGLTTKKYWNPSDIRDWAEGFKLARVFKHKKSFIKKEKLILTPFNPLTGSSLSPILKMTISAPYSSVYYEKLNSGIPKRVGIRSGVLY